MKGKIAAVLLVMFTIALGGWAFANYQVYLYNDCHMEQSGEVAGFCAAYLDFQPRIILWRSLAIEALAIVFYLLFRKFACSPKS